MFNNVECPCNQFVPVITSLSLSHGRKKQKIV